MERQLDGTVLIQDGRPFAGPIELIHHHSRFLDGFVSKPIIPCQRPPDVAPMAWPGFTMIDLEVELLQEAKKQGLKKVYFYFLLYVRSYEHLYLPDGMQMLKMWVYKPMLA